MGIAMDEFSEESSNPLPPPPRPPPKGHHNLSNADFRRIMMETPRRSDDHKDRSKSRSKRIDDDEGEAEKRSNRKYRPKPNEEEKPEELDLPKYRDRAKERRDDQNPDYDHTVAELGLHAVAPPGTVNLRATESHKISIEKSKFLGGDVEHTHLVKGLDYALLNKVRSEIDKKPDDEEDIEEAKRRLQREETSMTFRSASSKLVYQWIVKPQILNKTNEMFLPGRTTFVFDMDEEFSHDIPTTVHRSKADCPPEQETVTVAVDSTVLERIAKIMAYLRLGSSGKILKKKKKDKAEAKAKGLPALPEEGDIIADPQGVEGTEDTTRRGNGSSKLHDRDISMFKASAQKEQKALAAHQRNESDDIFVGVGADYTPPENEKGSPISEDMEESPRDPEKVSYGTEAGYGPVPPPLEGGEGVAWDQQGFSEGVPVGPVLPSAYPGEWQEYPQAPPETYAGPWLPDQYAYGEQYTLTQIPEFDVDPDASGEVQDPKFMTQEEKDRGLGSVFKRDDQRLQQRREKDAREKDPNFISESYSECYPGYQEYNREVVDSDEDEDLSKMDMGGRAKGRLHRWDFETEDEWAKYNEQKEAMPKAAFQFGVKMQDGRKTRKQKEQKLTNDLHKINQILEKRKKERGSGSSAAAATPIREEASHHDDEAFPSKRLRV